MKADAKAKFLKGKKEIYNGDYNSDFEFFTSHFSLSYFLFSKSAGKMMFSLTVPV